jgi:beta-glucosidase
MHPYQDTGTSPEARARDLVSRLTLEEKVAQLSGIWAYEVLTNFVFDEAKAKNRMGHGIGQITRAGGCTSLKPRDTARLVNRIQRFLKDTMRIHPRAGDEKSCAGLRPDADGFRRHWAWRRFSPEIAGEMGASSASRCPRWVPARRSRPYGLTRDPRWGRTEETYGETLSRGADGRSDIAACRRKTRRLVATGSIRGYGASEGGMKLGARPHPAGNWKKPTCSPLSGGARGRSVSIMPGYHD